METAAVNFSALGIDLERTPVVTRDQVRYGKPDPDLFAEAAKRLGARIDTAVVVGDSIWDMLAATRCRALGVGLLSGGYGADELRQAVAIRVYEDPADLCATLTRWVAADSAVPKLRLPLGCGGHLCTVCVRVE